MNYTFTFLSPAKLSGPFAHFADGQESSARSDPLVTGLSALTKCEKYQRQFIQP